MKFRTMACATALLLLLQQTAAAQEMTWFEATEILQRERLAGESCARVMKRHLPKDDNAALSRAERAYDEAAGEFNAVIAGLQAALIDDAEEPALETLKERIKTGSERRSAFCRDAETTVPSPKPGEKGLSDLIGVLGDVVGAIVTVWKELGDDDQVRRDNLRTALEDAKWPKFAAISP